VTNFTLNTNQLKIKAASLRQHGQELCRLGNQITQMVNGHRYLPTRAYQVQRIENLAKLLDSLGMRFISISRALDDIIDRVLRDDKVNENYVKLKLSHLVDETHNKYAIIAQSISNTKKSELEKVVEQVIYGDFAKEFSWLGFGVGVVLGFTPLGLIQDARDLTHTFATYKDRNISDNAVLIGLGVVGFLPLLGDLTKVEAKIIKNGTKLGTVTHSLNFVDETTTQIMKKGELILDGAKILGNGKSLLESSQLYADLVIKNVKWTWMKHFPDADLLTDLQKEQIRQFVKENNLIQKVDYKRHIYEGKEYLYADFSPFADAEVTLPKEFYFKRDDVHFKYADAIMGKKEDFTWHHPLEREGVLQRIPYGIHNSYKHDGAQLTWLFGRQR
jgi:hypothetical protein